MAPKKRVVRNSYYFFMKEMQEELAAKKQFKKMEEIAAIANPLWKQLSKEEKQKYEALAKEWKEEDKRQRAVQRIELQNQMREMATNPNPIEDTSDEVVPEIKKMIHYLYENDNLIDYPFIFISFNILCELEDLMIPREVALVKYTLKEGIKDVYHAFIPPTEIPIGYAAAAKELSDNVHSIPFENFEYDSSDDHPTIYKKILNFFQPFEYGDYPIAFSFGDKVGRHCLKWLYCQLPPLMRITPPNNFIFYNATLLLMELRAIMGKPYITQIQAKDCLNSHRFDYSPNTRCKFHDEVDNVHCALGNAKKLAYLFSNELYEIFEIDLTPNHLPQSKEKEDYFREIDIPKSKLPRAPLSKSRLSHYSKLDDMPNISSLSLETKPVVPEVAVQRRFLGASQAHFGVSTGVGIGRGLPITRPLGHQASNLVKDPSQKPPIDFASKPGNKPPAF